MMRASDFIKSKIKGFEGLVTQAYQDTAGVWTIGYGHTKGVKAGDVCTLKQADLFFEQDLRDVEVQLSCLLVREQILLSQNQFDALCSWCFNFGVNRLKYGSKDGKPTTLFVKLKALRFDEVPEQLLRWCKCYSAKAGGYVILNGLKKRREFEADLFRSR